MNAFSFVTAASDGFDDLFETELGIMLGAVAEFQDEYPASSLPRFVDFPDVFVTVGHGIISHTAAARIDRFVDCDTRFARLAHDRTGNRVTRREDVQALIAAEVLSSTYPNEILGKKGSSLEKFCNFQKCERGRKAIVSLSTLLRAPFRSTR